jgi:autotransporter-associated beta strand protein
MQNRHHRSLNSRRSRWQLCRLEDRVTPTLLYGVDTNANRLIAFDSGAPNAIIVNFLITGLSAAETVRGIDFRPTTGQLFALTVDNAQARIGTINPNTGAFTAIGAPFTVAGTEFGFDFNPTNDRLRITSDSTLNLLVDPNTAAVTVQGALNPGNPNINGSAYSNNFANATTTTLFAIDSSSNQLFQQVPATGALNLVGDLGVAADGPVGFDIAGNGIAYAALNVGGKATLHTINLATGTATPIGAVGSSSVPLTLNGLAVARFVWDGGGSGANWQAGQNWVADIAPQPGDDLVFPAGALQIANSTNDFKTGTNFNSIVFTGNGYNIKGNAIGLTAGLTDSSAGGLNQFSLAITLLNSQIVNVAQAGQTLALGGVISGGSGANLIKENVGSTTDNAGTLLFNGSAPNTYQGTTSVNGGLVQLAGAASATVTGPLSINNGAVLYLAGNQVGDAAIVSVNANGLLNLNGQTDVIGQLSVLGGIVETNGGKLTTVGNGSFDANATLVMQVFDPATSDRVTINGGVNLGGILQLVPTSIIPTGSVILLIENAGTGPTIGQFANATEGQVLNIGGVNAVISYKGGDGNDVTLTVQNTMSGRVYNDRDGNGLPTSPPLPGVDPGIAGVRVFDDANGNDAFDLGEQFTFTDANGNWQLIFNSDGPRTIRAVPPASFVQTTPQPPLFVLTAGQTITDVDFGLFQLATITGTVFNDLNGNGIRDVGEPGIPNVVVHLDKNNDGTIDQTAITNANGFYSFINLDPGTYAIRQVVPPGFVQTTADPPPLTPTSAAVISNVNFGNQQIFNEIRLFAVGAGEGGGPHVQVYNADGSIRFSFFAYDPGFRGGVTVATADVNGDGVDDIITGAGPGGGPHVKVFDGVNLNLLRSFFAYAPEFRGGVNVAAGDVNGDGRADIITGAGAGGGPHVIVNDAATLALLASFYAYDPSFIGGVNVAAGDVNGDESIDVVTGAGPGGGPHVKVFDIRNNTTVLDFFAYMADFMGGVYVAAGDVNGDGRADIITGGGFCAAPNVKVFSGATGQIMRLITPFAPTFIGGVRVGSADLNGDGIFEVLTGAGPSGGPAVKTYNGETGQENASFFAFDPAFMGGVFVG